MLNKNEVDLIQKMVQCEILLHDCWISHLNMQMQKQQKNSILKPGQIDEMIQEIEKKKISLNNDEQEILKKLVTQ